MNKKRKIINDPVFGFINIPNDFFYDLIQHPYFQRLNRIKQLGLSSVVYPGAQHTRMLHSLGAMHLMGEAVCQLRFTGVEITKEEADAVQAAILLHDVGHGPFSHTLEHTLVKGMRHEELSLLMMRKINQDFNGKLDLAIQIFKNEYPKAYLHQLVSGQLDMDRLDYLSRDSFFCGVTEGTIGASRIIKMLNIHDGKLVVEAKGIYSIEKFLVARRLMYWQVYLHKTSVAAEKMLTNIFKRAKELAMQGENLFASKAFSYFLNSNITEKDFYSHLNADIALEHFVQLDDSDIYTAVKAWSQHPDFVLSKLCYNFIHRKLFKVRMLEDSSAVVKEKVSLVDLYSKELSISKHEAGFFVGEEIVTTDTYDPEFDNINILQKNGSTKDIADASDMLNIQILTKKVEKHYLCYYQLEDK